MRLALLVAAWLVGVVLGLEAEVDAAPVLLLLLATLPAGLLLYFRRYSLWPAVLAGVLLLGLLRVEAADAPQALLVNEERQTVTIEGRIVDDPEATRQRIKFVLEVESVDRGTGREPLSAKALVYAEPPSSLASSRAPPFFRYGDTLLLEGELQRPRPISDFDYPSYLANQGISGVLWSQEAALTSQGAGSRWRGWIFDLRRELSERIEDALPPRQSALAQALLLGQRGRLPGGLVEDFRETGTSHLLAISGLHVGVLLVMSLGAAGWLMGRRRQLYLLFPLALIWLYALVSGEPASVVRAAIMGSVFLAALALGRPRSILPALALAAAVMVAISPLVLRQVSFQLSFAAMAGIAVALPYQARATAAVALRTTKIPAWIANISSWAASALVVSAGATLATWPLVAFNFHRIPMLGIFITMLALPALPFILMGALATAMGGLIHPALGQFFGWIAWAPLAYLVELVSRAPSFAVSGAWVGSGLVAAWYIGLGMLLLLAGGATRLAQRAPRLLWLLGQSATESTATLRPAGPTLGLITVAILLLAAVVFLWVQVFNGPDGKLHVYFLDVGQGDSALIVTPSGRQVLVDGGPDLESATRGLAGPLSPADRSLDMVVLTHLDNDHSRGLLEVLERYRVASVLVGLEQPDSVLYPQWKASLERQGLTEIPVEAGYEILLEEGVTLEVLNPPPEAIDGPSPEPNTASVVLRLVHGGVSFLLAADIDAEAEGQMLRGDGTLGSAVLKVAHHGSKTSTTEVFLARVDPIVAIISVGAENRFGQPHQEVVDRLGKALGPDKVYRTDRDGAVEFISDGERLWVRAGR